MEQLTASWSRDRHLAEISDGAGILARIPVDYSTHNHSWVKPKGNGKTEHGKIGIISCLRNGCFRFYTGCERCNERCYLEPDKKQSGCYADCTTFAMIRWNTGFSVIHNGVKPGTEQYFSLTLPKNNNYDLSRYPTRIYRIDSESSTSCLSLSLGITQRFAAANPGVKFTGISSDYFRVPEHMLEWAAHCGNIVIGHTLSPWFGVDDLKNRWDEALRYQAAGVPTCLWIVTRPDWEDSNPGAVALIDEAVDTFQNEQIIRLGYHDRSTHNTAGETENPYGVCCGTGVDSEGVYADMASRLRKDGSPAVGKLKGVCRKCGVLCGARWLNNINQLAA